MMKVRLSIAARDDLERIAEWIASESPRSSARVVRALRAKCLDLANSPYAYQPISGHEPRGIRRRPVGSYVVFYVVTDHILIVRVLHGARDAAAILFPDA